jgi:guanine deaminase
VCSVSLKRGVIGRRKSAHRIYAFATLSIVNQHLLRAVELSRNAGTRGEAPFGAVVADARRCWGEAHNEARSSHDPTAHAEVLAIRRAAMSMGTRHLGSCVLYTSCYPCAMCLSACYWARIPRIVFAATTDDAARAGYLDARLYELIRGGGDGHAGATITFEHVPRPDAPKVLMEFRVVPPSLEAHSPQRGTAGED